MTKQLKRLIKRCAWHYILFKNSTYQDISKQYGVSKTSLFKYFNTDLKAISPFLYNKVEKKKVRIEMERNDRLRNYNKCKNVKRG